MHAVFTLLFSFYNVLNPSCSNKHIGGRKGAANEVARACDCFQIWCLGLLNYTLCCINAVTSPAWLFRRWETQIHRLVCDHVFCGRESTIMTTGACLVVLCLPSAHCTQKDGTLALVGSVRFHTFCFVPKPPC